MDDPSKLYFFMAKLNLSLGKSEAAQGRLRDCIHEDPDNPKCISYYKRLHSAEKRFADMEEACRGFPKKLISQMEQFLQDIETNPPLPQDQPSSPTDTFKIHPVLASIYAHPLGNPNTPLITKASERLCSEALKAKDAASALKYCSRAADFQPGNVDWICAKADALFLNEEYDNGRQTRHFLVACHATCMIP